MKYKGTDAKMSKLEYAKAAAACLSYLVLHQRDSVSLAFFDEEIREHLPRREPKTSSSTS